MMKFKIFLAAVLLTIFTGCDRSSNDQSTSPSTIQADYSKPFKLILNDGNELKMQKRDDGYNIDIKDKAIFLNFFATWCPPCQKELAEMQNTLWPKYKDNKDFALLVVGREHTDADLQKYNEKKGFTFPLYPDKNRAIYGSFAKNLIPRCYLVDKSGKIIYATKGFKAEDFAELMKKIEEALK